MFNLQGSEIIIILLLALVVLGPEKLPDAIRRFAQTYAELKKMGSGFQSELKSALDEPMREMRETATLIQNAADPAKVAAQAEEEAKLRDAEAAALAAVDADPDAHGVLDPGLPVATSPSTPFDPPSGPPIAGPSIENADSVSADTSHPLPPPTDPGSAVLSPAEPASEPADRPAGDPVDGDVGADVDGDVGGDTAVENTAEANAS